MLSSSVMFSEREIAVVKTAGNEASRIERGRITECQRDGRCMRYDDLYDLEDGVGMMLWMN